MLNNLRFHHQLIVIFSVGVILLALVTAFTVTFFSKKAVKERIIEESFSLAKNIAQQSKLSLLYKSPDSAKEIVNIFMSFPDVDGISIVNPNFDILYSRGSKIVNLSYPVSLLDSVEIVFEDREYLIFAAPVIIGTQNVAVSSSPPSNEFITVKPRVFDSSLSDSTEPDFSVDSVTNTSQTPEMIGIVKLAISKSSLRSISRGIFKFNLSVSIGLSCILLLVLLIMAKRITRPMEKLSRLMQKAQTGAVIDSVDLSGPKDIHEIKKAFNGMMVELKRREREIKKARDQAYESAAEKAQFAANVSHELRTPMNGVLGMLDLLAEKGLSDSQLEYVRIARKSGQSLLTLIDDVLDFSKNESIEAFVEEKEFDLISTLEDIMSLLGSKATDKKIDFCFDVSEKLGATYKGDIDKIRQILINLIGNALKFTTRGGVFVSVKHNTVLCSTNSEKETLEFTVEDTGVGISQAAKEKIFDAFAQGDNSPSRQFGGTGLGLAISRQLVSMLEGDLTVASEQGKGSVFSFSLPLLRIKNIKPACQKKISSCLVVSPMSMVSHSVEFMLRPYVDNIVSVASINASIDYVNQQSHHDIHIDLVLLDQNIQNNFDYLCTMDKPTALKNTVYVTLGWDDQTKKETIYPVHHHIEKPAVRHRFHPIFHNYFERLNLLSSSEVMIHDDNTATEPLTLTRALNVLVVEDIETNWLVAKGMLQALNCEASIARNGRECLTLLQNKKFDVVLMDCHMPIMDGYTATSVIRNKESGTQDHLIVIAMTANNLTGEKEKCFAKGMDDFLSKPLSRERLEHTLSKWCGESKAALSEETLYGHEDIPADISDVLDVKKIMELKLQMGDAMGTLITSFNQHIEEHLSNLSLAMQDSKPDVNKIRFTSHAIKGSASNFGATRLVELSRDLEIQIDKINSEDAAQHIHELKAESNKVMQALKKL